MLISHTMPNVTHGSSTGYYRGSLIDTTDPSFYIQSVFNANSSVGISPTFNLTYDHYGYEALSADQTSVLHTWSTIPELTFDLTIYGTSTALLDGAVGTFYFGTEMPVYEWGMPACQTSGTIQVNGETLTVDPSQSFTWYDRQWGGGVVSNWTWFQIHLGTEDKNNDAPVKASIWIIDPVDGSRIQFATVRREDGIQEVIPVSSFITRTERVYHSPVFGLVYPLDWLISLADGTDLTVSSIRPDQQMVGDSLVSTVYEGFVNVTINDKKGKEYTTFGVVEMVTV
jgi:predicted secreted hydrolase